LVVGDSCRRLVLVLDWLGRSRRVGEAVRVWHWLALVTAGAGLGLAIQQLRPASAIGSEPMPMVCRAPDPERIDGVCWDGQAPRVMMRGFAIVQIQKETYLVGYPE
jgi:hypothetical protein